MKMRNREALQLKPITYPHHVLDCNSKGPSPVHGF